MKKNSQAFAALVVFLLFFIGIGYIGIGWLFPYLGLAATSVWALVLWGILLFLALVMASAYSKKSVIGAKILFLMFRNYILVWVRMMGHEFLFAVSRLSNTRKIRALGSKL